MEETWAAPSGFSKYGVSADGFGPRQRPVRSIDRTVNGRRIRGVLLKPKVGTHGYLEVKVYDDGSSRRAPCTVWSCWRTLAARALPA